MVADNSLNYFDIVHRFERALAAYPGTGHRAYPEFYGTIRLTFQLGDNSPRVGALNMSALKLLAECFADGSFKPGDQQEIAEMFVNDWGSDFFSQCQLCLSNYSSSWPVLPMVGVDAGRRTGNQSGLAGARPRMG